MGKNKVRLIVTAAIGLLTSFFLLWLVFDYDMCQLFSEFLVATFTGCVIAVPGGCLLIIEERKRVRREQVELLSNLCFQFDNIDFTDYRHYNVEKTEIIQHNIAGLYYQLGEKLAENYLENREELRNLQDGIFDFSRAVVDLNNLYKAKKNMDEKEFNKRKNLVCIKKAVCLRLIEEIQSQ